jgi:solute carrier family 34 (sodium-dependent phosphate cotransporter)
LDNAPLHKEGGISIDWQIAAVLVAMFVLFFLAMDVLISALGLLGDDFTRAILTATSNPFAALFIALLATALLQSSSTTTSLIVALAASHRISFDTAIAMTMGANIGTTITSTMVSFAFISKRKEYKRALTIGTYHDFFNIMTALVLFPLEYQYGILSSAARFIARAISPATTVSSSSAMPSTDGVTSWLFTVFPYPIIVAVLALMVLVASVLVFRRLVSRLFGAERPEAFRKFIFRRKWKSFLWGAAITAAIRSSTVTTSIVVPMVAKRITTVRNTAPFILGANIGTTLTALIVVIVNIGTQDAIAIALVHVLFNTIGVVIFSFIPVVKEAPTALARGLGGLALRYRLVGLAYLLLTFFLVPFLLIYLTS